MLDEQESRMEESSGELESLASELGEAIASLPEHERFTHKEKAVAENEAVQKQIQAFEEKRDAFYHAQQTGTASQEDLDELQALQQELHEMPVMAEYLDAKASFVARLEELNRTISDPLSVDFGGEAGGCCHD